MDFSFLDDWTEEEESAATIEEVGEGYRNIWVVAETENGEVCQTPWQPWVRPVRLADQIGVYVYAVLLGEGVGRLAEPLIACGADKVLVVDDPALTQYQPEVYVKIVGDLVDQYHPEILLLSATPLGNDLAPRLAQRLNTGLISHCVKLDLDMSERLLLGPLPCSVEKCIHTAACPEARPQMATLQPGYFRAPYEDTYRSGDVQAIDAGHGGSDWKA